MSIINHCNITFVRKLFIVLLFWDISTLVVDFLISVVNIVKTVNWTNFQKSTVGHQLVRSADSISANIAEGFGRYHKKDKIKFYRSSMGSTTENN